MLDLGRKGKKALGLETYPLLVPLASLPPEYEMDISLHTPDLYQHYSHFYFLYKKIKNKTHFLAIIISDFFLKIAIIELT